jgi:hypothetical protein
MKRRMRPIAHTRDQSVLDRIDAAIFDMAHVIGLVADQMLPEPTLPDAAFAAGRADGTEPFLFWQRPGKTALDEAPASREIAVAGRQRPDRMQVIWQDDERIDGEGMILPGRSDGLAQGGDMVDEQGPPSLQQIDCEEEEAPARNERAMIVRHVRYYSTRRITPSAPIRPTESC